MPQAWRERAFNTSEGPGPCDSYTESTSKALMPWGLSAGFCPVFPAQIPQFRKRLWGPCLPRFPSPHQGAGTHAGKECLFKG